MNSVIVSFNTTTVQMTETSQRKKKQKQHRIVTLPIFGGRELLFSWLKTRTKSWIFASVHLLQRFLKRLRLLRLFKNF